MADDPNAAGTEDVEPEETEGLRALEAPWLYASSFRLQGMGNDFILILQRAIPVQGPDGAIQSQRGKLETVAVLTLSPQAAKDLHLLLEGSIASYESQFGRIETQFTKRRAAQQKTGERADT